jgi:hypothetical protein
MKVVGLTKEALNYIYKHSAFVEYDGNVETIGCGYSDGFASVSASLYNKKKINEDVICLFQYHLDNGIAKEVIQEVKDDNIFLCLSVNNRRKFKWRTEDY